MVGVAQLVRAPDCGSGGRRFDSVHPPHSAGTSVPALFLGMSPSGKAQDFDSCSRGFESRHPSQGTGQPFLGLSCSLSGGIRNELRRRASEASSAAGSDMPGACRVSEKRIPPSQPTSSRTAYRSRRGFFSESSPLTRSVVGMPADDSHRRKRQCSKIRGIPPLQIGPAPLGSDLGNMQRRRERHAGGMSRQREENPAASLMKK